jgi:hypothetical protein
VVVDVGLLEVLLVRIRMGLVDVLDLGVVVLVSMTGQLVLPEAAVPQVVGHVQVLVVMDQVLVPVLLHARASLVR